MRNFVCILFASVFVLVSCKDAGTNAPVTEEENQEAKAMLQGIWLNDEDEEVTMKIKGDTIVYADSTLTPVWFAVIDDSLVLRGYNETRYEILKQSENVFQFKNHSGDVVKLVKSNNPNDSYVFENRKPSYINQNKLIKRDSVVTSADKKYRIYTQVNPSTYKVVKTSYNQDGVQAETIYYDNIINICMYDAGKRLFSRDFRKQDFQKHVPAQFLKQAILSDIVIDKVSERGIELLAQICVPDTITSYVVRIIVTHDGKMSLSVDKN